MIEISPQDYLTLQLVRLQRSSEWSNSIEGLTFILLKGGKSRYILPNRTWNVLPGDVLVLNGVDVGQLQAQGTDAVFWRFSVCFEHLLPLFTPGEICLLQDVAENFKGSKIYLAANPLAQECHALVDGAPPHGNVAHRSQTLRIAATILSVELTNAHTHRSGFARVEDHMKQVFESLSATELLTLSVGDLANKFCCSRRHLNRLFHQHFGFSVAALRMELRLLKAVSLLRDPDTKVIMVAEQCGFNHLGLFNTCFKRRFGSSPGQWRKNASASGVVPGMRIVKANGAASGKFECMSPSAAVEAKAYQVLQNGHRESDGDRDRSIRVFEKGDARIMSARYRPSL
jgi:AraC-like DNA-binding protein